MESISNSEVSDLVDPLIGYFPSFLLPHSIKSSSSSSGHLPNPDSSNLDSLHNYLKARVLSSPDKWLRQGKTILEDDLDHLKTDKTEAVLTKNEKTDKTEAVLTKNEKAPRGRRPGLGLDLRKFSAKLMPSQSPMSMDFNIDIEKLSDPKECIAAFERMEAGRKEVQRLKGEPLVDLDQNRPPRKPRPSLGGKPATYTHRPYPVISLAGVDETSLPSRRTVDDAILSPKRNLVLRDANVMNDSPSVQVTDSKSTTTRKLSELDELLSLDLEGLKEDEVHILLRDKLQIKPLDIGKSVLPYCIVPPRKSFTSTSALPEINDTVFHLSDATASVRSRDQVSSTSTKSKSPLASISSLSQHIPKCTPSKDPFSIPHIDISPAEPTNPTGDPEKRVDQGGDSNEADVRKNLCELREPPAHGVENFAVSGADSFVSAANDADPISELTEKEDVVGQFDQLGNRMDSRELGLEHGEEMIVVSGENALVSASKDVGRSSESEMLEDEVAAVQLSVRQQLIFEGLDMDLNSTGVEKGGMNEPSDTENISVEEPYKGAVGPSKRKRKEKVRSKAPSEAVVSEEPVMKEGQAETSQSDAPVSRETRSKRRKVEGTQPRRSKEQLRRFSLYHAGTKWESGVRRSTRIRMRPLETWKGERYLYGRVHESLVTVIGVKYASPSKGNKEPGIKVKSFVSDKYKDLIKFASLH